MGTKEPAYETETLIVERDALREIVLPKLLGTIFHVTSSQGFEGIKASGAIGSNRKGELPSTFPQSANGYGRRRGYVCLFDLREVTDEQLNHALEGFYFLDPFGSKDDPVFLLLSPAEYGEVIHWSATNGDYTEMWMPYVEAWYPRDLPLAAINQAVVVEVKRPPPSLWELALDEANRKRNEHR